MKTTIFPIKRLGQVVNSAYALDHAILFGKVLIMEWCLPEHETKKTKQNKDSCVE